MRAERKFSVQRLAAAALVGLFAFVSVAQAQQRDLEPAVKATFLMRFAAFVRWPPSSFTDAEAPVVICVAGDGALASLVETAARGERVGARAIAVRRYGAPQDVEGCHILYAGGAPGQSVAQLLEQVRNNPVLTVTDQRRSGVRGMIHFAIENDRVRFHINRDAADAVGLEVNARLLSVALSVRSRRSS
jgi:hypothetical protein